MRAIFKDYHDMLVEADKLIQEDDFDSQDRASIQSFYNGRETMSAEKAAEQGVDNITNHLFGFDSLDLSRRQIESIYTKSVQMFTVELPKADPRIRDEWERRITADLNRAIKESRRFKPEWKGLSGELTLFGRGVFMFRDNEDWCPVITRPFTPRGTGILPNQVPYCVVPDYLTLNDLHDAVRSCDRRKEMKVECYWKRAELMSLIAIIEQSLNGNPIVGGLYSINYNTTTAEELSETEQMGALGEAGLRTRIPVYYFYIANQKKKGCPFDLVILPRLTALQQKSLSEKAMAVPTSIYDRSEYFDCAEHFLHPFFVDCELGGKTSWHRVMGLGRLNYDPDVELEEFFNEAMVGSRENIRRLYQVGTASDWEVLKNWADGRGPTNVLPPGVQLAEQNKSPNFQYAFQTIGMLSQLTKRNASSNVQNIDDGKANELEVNAVERQGRNAEALAARMGDIYECGDSLGKEILRRFLSDDSLECDKGYEEIKKFHKCLREYKIPRATVAKWLKDGNVTVKTSRSAGDGDTVRRRMANAMLMSRLQMFSSESQQIILRRVVAEETMDYDFAEQVVPYEQVDPPDQVERSNDENEQCARLGLIGIIPKLSKDDLDTVHIKIHFQGMQADLKRAEIRPWDKVDLAGFQALGSHSAMHIQKLMANPEMKEMGSQLMQTLEGLAKQGQEFSNNLQKQDAANQIGAKEQAELELKGRKQDLSERSQNSLEEHRQKALNLSAYKADINNEVARDQIDNSKDSTAHKQMIDEELALTETQSKSADVGLKRAQAKAAVAEEPLEQPIPEEEDVLGIGPLEDL